MKKMISSMKTLVALLMVGATVTSCSSDNEMDSPKAPAAKTYTMTVEATKGDGGTRALADGGTTLTSTWSKDDVVEVWSEDGTTTKYGELTATAAGSSTTLTGTLTTKPNNNETLTLKYLSPNYSSQDGTLTGTDNSIDRVCDYATATVTATVDGDNVTTTDATFENQQAVVKFTLKNKANDSDLSATKLTVIADGNTYTVTPSSAASVLYVAVPAISAKQVTLIALADNMYYDFANTSATFENGKFYRVTVKMTDGTLSGKFSVSATKKVYFSKGNLQATYNGTDWTWAFAANQWDYIGNAAGNTSINGNGTVNASNVTVDLFGWVGASSTWTGAAQYGISNSAATNNTNGYGNNASEALKSGWGNTIGSGWRTLTSDEWTYLFNTRTTTSGVRYAKATVNGKSGVILLPDDWSTSYYSLSSTNTADAAYTTNSITSTDWTNSLEAHGAVFLPAAGYRSQASVSDAGSDGNYWSSSPNTSSAFSAYRVYFYSGFLTPASSRNRYYGCSVRLVKNVN